MPVPLYLSGVVIIFAFLRSKSGIFDLTLEKISHSQTASYKGFCNAFNHLINAFKDLTVSIKGLFSKANKNHLIRIFICFQEFPGLS